jgi:HD-like signal output (HDOD) protein
MYRLDQLLGASNSLPSIPRVIALTLNELNKDEPDLMQLRNLLGEDPILTSRLLQMVNSAAFGLHRQLSSVHEALTVLGLGQVRDVVLTAALVASFNQVRAIPMRQFWRYSLNVAKLSRRLAHYREVGPSPFTAGLLSAVGELILHKGQPLVMEKIDTRCPWFAVERAGMEMSVLSYCYAQASGGFARAWSLGEDLAVILETHDGPPFTRLVHPLAGVLKLASWRARTIEAGMDVQQLKDSFPELTARALGMDLPTVLAYDLVEWTSSAEVEAFAR